LTQNERRQGGVAGVLLAAGTGKRLGRVKALVEFDGSRLAERGVRTLARGGCRPVLVVLGASADEVEEACALDEAIVVTNEAWQEGMGGSVRLALAEAVELGVEAVVILPVDQPLVSAELVSRLIDAWRSGAAAAVATYRGEQATPVALDRSLFDYVASSAVGDVGARAFLRSNPDLVTPVACEDVGDPSDIDTEEDLLRIENLARTVP